LKIISWSELKPHIDVFEADGKARTGLLVANNPINYFDPDGLGKIGFIIKTVKGIKKFVSKNTARRCLKKDGDVDVVGSGASKEAKRFDTILINPGKNRIIKIRQAAVAMLNILFSEQQQEYIFLETMLLERQWTFLILFLMSKTLWIWLTSLERLQGKGTKNAKKNVNKKVTSKK